MSYAILSTKTDIETPETGIEAKRQLATALTGVLADSFVLMIKSQGYHWNVVGPLFQPIHDMTQVQYRDLFDAIDVIAERIRALGQVAPGSFTDLIAHAEIDEETRLRSAGEMVTRLVEDHETIARRFRKLSGLAAEAGDGATEDLSNARIAFHEKSAWMLCAIVAE
ncbi:MAG: DNA starvation/stationary phase protection protein [Pseudomonadota bacterium]